MLECKNQGPQKTPFCCQHYEHNNTVPMGELVSHCSADPMTEIWNGFFIGWYLFSNSAARQNVILIQGTNNWM
jgi:hypothetical protein